MLKLFILSLCLGTLSTCFGSPFFWYNIVVHHTIWGDEKRLGINKAISLRTLVRSYLSFFALTVFTTFFVYRHFSLYWGTFTAIACIGISHIWSSAFYTRLEAKNFLIFKIKLSAYFLGLISYFILGII